MADIVIGLILVAIGLAAGLSLFNLLTVQINHIISCIIAILIGSLLFVI